MIGWTWHFALLSIGVQRWRNTALPSWTQESCVFNLPWLRSSEITVRRHPLTKKGGSASSFGAAGSATKGASGPTCATQNWRTKCNRRSALGRLEIWIYMNVPNPSKPWLGENDILPELSMFDWCPKMAQHSSPLMNSRITRLQLAMASQQWNYCTKAPPHKERMLRLLFRRSWFSHQRSFWSHLHNAERRYECIKPIQTLVGWKWHFAWTIYVRLVSKDGATQPCPHELKNHVSSTCYGFAAVKLL